MIGATAAHGGAGTCVLVLKGNEQREWGLALCWGTVHAQGLEGLDGVIRPELDECFDDVEAPCRHSVRPLEGIG